MRDGPERRQLAHDALLVWCSELGSGSWAAFAAAARDLGLAASAAARGLSMLGHVEFCWRTRTFAATPGALTTIPGMPGRLLACGQRPLGFLENLRRAAEASGLDVDVAHETAHQFGIGPGSVYVDCDPVDAPAFAHAVGLAFAPDAALAIAMTLPALTVRLAAEPATPDRRFPHCPVDPDTLIDDWNAAVDGNGYHDGLWAWRTWQRPRAVYLRRDGTWLLLPISEHGPYLIDRDDPDALIRYDAANRVLAVDGRAALPELHARAACLCSGRLPLPQPYAPGFHDEHYMNVPPAVAHTLIETLIVGDRA